MTEATTRRPILEEGMTAGLSGAGVLAVWFLLLDSVRGMPFFTPIMLGAVIFDGADAERVTEVSTKTAFAYSGLHVILFLIVGFGLSWMFRELEDHPAFGIVYALVVVMFEIVIFGLEIAMLPSVIGILGSWAVVIGNILSAAAMCWFLWRCHPRSVQRMVEAWHT